MRVRGSGVGLTSVSQPILALGKLLNSLSLVSTVKWECLYGTYFIKLEAVELVHIEG